MKPLVTLLVPVYQERRFIEPLCAMLDAQTWPPDRLEVLFLDGGSTDGTREFLESRAFACRARVVPNPRRLQVHALNLGLSLAAGEFVLRWDAHATYAPDFLERCVDRLVAEPDVVDCGGPALAQGYDFVSGVAADVLRSPLGVGGARFRYADRLVDSDTVFPGAFRRADLVAAGGWDGRFAVAEDIELSLRLRSTTGRRIVVDPAIRCSYFPRNTVGGLARQYARFGLYRIRLARLRPGALRRSHVLSLALLPAVVLGPVAGAAVAAAAGSPWGWLLAAPLPLYVLGALGAAAFLAARTRERPVRFVRRTAVGFLCLGALHLGWSAGGWAGLLGPFRAFRDAPRS